MQSYCYRHGGEIEGGWSQNYGYVVETERYRYCVRCNPVKGDYQCYLSAFDLRVQEMNQAQRQKTETAQPELEQFDRGMTMGGI